MRISKILHHGLLLALVGLLVLPVYAQSKRTPSSLLNIRSVQGTTPGDGYRAWISTST